MGGERLAQGWGAFFPGCFVCTWNDAVKLKKLLDLRLLRVHEQINQLAVRASHALGIQNFVSPPNLEDRLKEGSIRHEVVVSQKSLAVLYTRSRKKKKRGRAQKNAGREKKQFACRSQARNPEVTTCVACGLAKCGQGP